MSKLQKVMGSDRKYIVKVRSSDEVADYLNSKLEAGSYVDFTISENSATGSEKITIDLDAEAVASALTTADEKVKATSGATDADYLDNVLTDTGGEISISASGGGDALNVSWEAAMDNLSDATISDTPTKTQFIMRDTPGSVDNTTGSVYDGTDFFDTSSDPDVDQFVTREDIIQSFRDEEIEDSSGNSLFWKSKFFGPSDITLQIDSSGIPGTDDVTYQTTDSEGEAFRYASYVRVGTDTTSSFQSAAFVTTMIDPDYDTTSDPELDIVIKHPTIDEGATSTSTVGLTVSAFGNGETLADAWDYTATLTFNASDTESATVDYETETISSSEIDKDDGLAIAFSVSLDGETPQGFYDLIGVRLRYKTKKYIIHDDDITTY